MIKPHLNSNFVVCGWSWWSFAQGAAVTHHDAYFFPSRRDLLLSLRLVRRCP